MKRNIKIVLPANLDYSSLIRHIADEVFGMAKFSKPWCNRLKLVVDELFMNAVGYGSTKDQSSVYATFEFDEEAVHFTIEDDGTGVRAVPFEELRAIIERNKQNSDLTRTSGRGLAMIANLWTDEIGVEKSEHGGVAVHFTKRVDVSEPPPPPPPPADWVEAAKKALQPLSDGSTPTPKSPPSMTTIKIKGTIDQSNVEQRTAHVFDAIDLLPAGGVLALDMAECDYVNSTFIGNLAAWHTTLQHKKGHLQLKNLSPEVKDILDLVGLLKVINQSNQ